MKRDDWSNLATFAAIAEAGSFSKAAVRLGVSPSALSHALRLFEERLGVRLLNRTTRSLAPTQAGERLLARLRPAMADMTGALQDLDAERTRPSGLVRISAHRTAALHAILPRLPKLASDYPDVAVELVVDDGLVDIVAGRFDAGVRAQKVLDQDMVSVRIGAEQRVAIVATPDYFTRFPRPVVPEDLRRHRGLNYRYTSSGTIHEWAFAKEGRSVSLAPPGGFVSNDGDVILEAALNGLGIACVPETQIVRPVASGELVRVLDDWSPALPADYLYYPSRRQMSTALRAFIEAVRYHGP